MLLMYQFSRLNWQAKRFVRSRVVCYICSLGRGLRYNDRRSLSSKICQRRLEGSHAVLDEGSPWSRGEPCWDQRRYQLNEEKSSDLPVCAKKGQEGQCPFLFEVCTVFESGEQVLAGSTRKL